MKVVSITSSYLEWISLVAAGIVLVILTVYMKALTDGSVFPNKRVSNKLFYLTVLAIIWRCLGILTYYFDFESPFVNFGVKFLGNQLLLFNLLQNIETAKLFSVLVEYWNVEKLTILQISITFFHFLILGSYYFIEFIPSELKALHIWSEYGFIIWIVFQITCDTLIAFYLSHVVRKDSIKHRPNYYDIDLTKFNVFYKNLQSNLFYVIVLDLFAFGLYLLGGYLSKKDSVEIATAIAVQRIGGLQLCLQPLVHGFIFLSMLKMRFSRDLRIVEDMKITNSTKPISKVASVLPITSKKVALTPDQPIIEEIGNEPSTNAAVNTQPL
ncbi:hypothetical protein HDV02_005725 [Globomyces sp. JEL0801]|nr:hypothetical protein HDV02_005725 [Globomyces sp. JEL0801]